MSKSKEIDGKTLAFEKEVNLKERLTHLKSNSPVIPQAVSFYCEQEDDPHWTSRYTLLKQKKAEEWGIHFKPNPYPPNTSFSELVKRIAECNIDPYLHGIMFQLPLSEKLESNRDQLLQIINPRRDVDGQTVGGRHFFVPPTIKAVLSVANEYFPDLTQEQIMIEGSNSEDGKLLIETFIKKGIPYKTSQNEFSQASLVILTSGDYRNLIADIFPENVIIIDTAFKKLDDSIYQKCRAYTPQIGGLGPLVIISLMENIVDSYERYVLI